jgi:hypothetical protein
MQTTLLIILICMADIVYANDTTGIKIIHIDSLKKNYTGITKTYSNKIQLAKTDFAPWGKMSVVEKGKCIFKTISNGYRL